MMNKSFIYTKTVTPATLPQDLAKNLQRIKIFEEAGNLAEADALCKKILRKYPQHPAALHCAGSLATKQNQPQLAINYFNNALQISPNDPAIYKQLGAAHYAIRDFNSAIANLEKAILLYPNDGETHHQLSLALTQIHATEMATKHYHQAVECFYQTASVFHSVGNFAEALVYYQKTFDCQPNHFDAYQRAADICSKLNQWEEAIEYLNRALSIKSDNTVYLKLSKIYQKLEDYANLIATYREALEHYPEDIHFLESLLMVYKNCCAWNEATEIKQRLTNLADLRLARDLPFLNFNYAWTETSVAKQLVIAKNIAKHQFSQKQSLREKLGFNFSRPAKSKIRIGYLSADIRNHPTAHLMMNMFPHHNRERFEIYLYSIGPKDGSIYSQRIPTLCDHFRDLYELSFEQCAQQIYADQIDILIDTMGHTQSSRTAILELRPAPIQICYLGFPATMGANFVDYLVTDRIVIPPDQAQYYAEKLLYMPHTFFVTDNQQSIAAKPSRQTCNLPEDTFVFCCFNNAYKLDAKVFAIWMRILQQIPNAVAWFQVDIPMAKENICKEAENRGISLHRLIFAPRLPKAEHLARLQLADLFLDCLTINAHTTAIDALWTGLPVITCPDQTIASRAATSILTAMEMPELIAANEHQYEEMALHYARNVTALKAAREKIINKKTTAPLFNTKQYVMDLEANLEKAWKLYTQSQ